MEYVAHITLLSSISKYRCFYSSLIVKRKSVFFYFLPSNKSNVENLIKRYSNNIQHFSSFKKKKQEYYKKFQTQFTTFKPGVIAGNSGWKFTYLRKWTLKINRPIERLLFLLKTQWQRRRLKCPDNNHHVEMFTVRLFG